MVGIDTDTYKCLLVALQPSVGVSLLDKEPPVLSPDPEKAFRVS